MGAGCKSQVAGSRWQSAGGHASVRYRQSSYVVRNEFGKRQCVEALLTPCPLPPAARYVRGPKPMTDAELTILRHGSDNHSWGQPRGGARVWRAIQTEARK